MKLTPKFDLWLYGSTKDYTSEKVTFEFHSELKFIEIPISVSVPETSTQAH